MDKLVERIVSPDTKQFTVLVNTDTDNPTRIVAQPGATIMVAEHTAYTFKDQLIDPGVMRAKEAAEEAEAKAIAEAEANVKAAEQEALELANANANANAEAETPIQGTDAGADDNDVRYGTVDEASEEGT